MQPSETTRDTIRLSQCQQGYQLTHKQNLPGRNQPSAHRTILNIGIWYYLLHVEDSITMIALPAKAMWLKGAKQKPERNPGRELISHMPIRDS